MITDSQLLRGPTFSVRLPPGITVTGADAAAGYYTMLLPPGASQFNAQGQIHLRAIPQLELALYLQNINNFDNPNVVLASYAFLGLGSVTNLVPVQQTSLPQGPAYLLQFDGFLMNGAPVRVLDMLIQGPAGGVEVFIFGNPYSWAQLTQPAFQVIAGIQMVGSTGGAVPAAPADAVMDRQRYQQPEGPVTAGAVAARIAAHAEEIRIVYETNIYGNVGVVGEHGVASGNQTMAQDSHATNVGGNVSGTGNAVGSSAQGQVTTTEESRDENPQAKGGAR